MDARTERAVKLHQEGIRLLQSGDYARAEQSMRRSIEIMPRIPDWHTNLGLVLFRSRDYERALACHDRALALDPGLAGAHYNRGLALREIGDAGEALKSFERALTLNPRFAEVHFARSLIERQRRQFGAAMASLNRAIQLKPDYLDAVVSRARLLMEDGQLAEAATEFRRAGEIAPEWRLSKGDRLQISLLTCDWEGLEELKSSIERDVEAGVYTSRPYYCLAAFGSDGLLRDVARIFAREVYPEAADRLRRAPTRLSGEGERVRVGYISSDFRQHAVSILLTGVLERHDRSRFDVVGFDIGRDDGGELRARQNRAIEMVDLSNASDQDAAAEIARRGIDILVDLNGYTSGERTGIFARRPAPIQVNYLGYPGTLGADYIDYIIADRYLAPGSDAHFTEKVVLLPDTQLPNDDLRIKPDLPLKRSDFGLPETGFVFCSFSNAYKILPEIFEVWMRLLQRVEDSVLWLRHANDIASANLRRQAGRHGLGDRIVFAANAPMDVYLARYRLADLFLDTLPYNAHTTASDALWAGLPVLTATGSSLAGRLATSILNAVGMPELVANGLANYEALALALAGDRARVAGIRDRLAANRSTHPLFDTRRYTRHLEAAYLGMIERNRAGLAPESFAVEGDGA